MDGEVKSSRFADRITGSIERQATKNERVPHALRFLMRAGSDFISPLIPSGTSTWNLRNKTMSRTYVGTPRRIFIAVGDTSSFSANCSGWV